MGNRSQALIHQDSRSDIYLYSHWDGSDIGNMVKRALQRRQRWDDPEYLTRIIFCEMVKDDIDGETGYGIGTQQHGDVDWLIEIDVPKQEISIGSQSWTFTEYIA